MGKGKRDRMTSRYGGVMHGQFRNANVVSQCMPGLQFKDQGVEKRFVDYAGCIRGHRQNFLDRLLF